MDENKILIIDGNSLINRAYFAMHNPMITSKGVYTQGIFGFLNMLWKVLDDYNPLYATVAWDRKAPTFRRKSYEGYKAGRKSMPVELAMELPYMKDILEAMDIKNLEMDGFEADDILGTIARLAEDEGMEVLIVTGDKDALQLASDKTKVMITRKGISTFDLYDEDRMQEEYGMTPHQFIDLKGLMGDSSDNYPGVPGVGPKKGMKLIHDYGSIENLLQHTDELKGKLKENVEENVQQILLSRRLAEIRTDVPLDVDVREDLKMDSPDGDKLVELFHELEFKTFMKRLSDRGLISQPEKEMRSYTTVAAHEPLDLAPLKELEDGSELGLLVIGNEDHVEDPRNQMIALLFGDMYYCIDPALEKDVIELFNRKHFRFYGHDLIRSYYPLMMHGLQAPETAFDTQVAQYLLAPSSNDYSLSSLAMDYLQVTLTTEKELMKSHAQTSMFDQGVDEELLEYGKAALDAVYCIRKEQEPKLKQEEMADLALDVEFPLVSVLSQMEVNGVEVDKAVLDELGKELADEIEQLEASIYELAGEEFNINSTQQLGEILFEKMGLPALKKTKRGYSTSADVLNKLKDESPIIEQILHYRTMSKLKSTYIDGFIPLISSENRIRAHFQQTVAATGRLSCTAPNLQNIPVRTEVGRQLRKAFVAGVGRTLVGADYSQIELRILAHLSGDENLINAFNQGEDIHRTTAARVFGKEYDDVTPLDRSRAKAVNFGVIYGMSAFGLSEEIQVSRKEADQYIQDYFSKHPSVKAFMDGCVETCKKLGYTETLLGRRRYIREIGSKNFMTRQLGERLAMNSPIQGTAADIIKMAMISVSNEMRERGLKSKLVLQIHDELIIQAEADEVETVKELLQRNMEEAITLKVQLLCDAKTGKSWFELKD